MGLKLNSSVLQICEKVRGYRFDTAKVAEMEKACRKLKGIVPRPESLREVRQTVSLIHFCRFRAVSVVHILVFRCCI